MHWNKHGLLNCNKLAVVVYVNHLEFDVNTPLSKAIFYFGEGAM